MPPIYTVSLHLASSLHDSLHCRYGFVDGHQSSQQDVTRFAASTEVASLHKVPLPLKALLWRSCCMFDTAFVSINSLIRWWQQEERDLIWECWQLLHKLRDCQMPAGYAASKCASWQEDRRQCCFVVGSIVQSVWLRFETRQHAGHQRWPHRSHASTSHIIPFSVKECKARSLQTGCSCSSALY
jgi:hypothetical protein